MIKKSKNLIDENSKVLKTLKLRDRNWVFFRGKRIPIFATFIRGVSTIYT